MKKIFSSALFMITLLTSAFAQAALQPLVVVKLNGVETITLKDLKDTVETYEAQANKKFNVSQRKELLNSLIDQKLIVQAAKKEGISVSDSQVDQRYLASMSQIVGRQVTEKEFADIVKQTQNKTVDEFLKSQVRMNVAQYKAYLKSQIIAQQYVVAKKEDEIKNVQATPEEINDYYELNKAKLVWNDMVRMFLVSVQKGDNPAAAKEKIQSLIKDFNANKITVTSMREATKDPAKAGYIAGELMVEKTEQFAQM